MKQESQRRVRSAALPARSFSSSTAVQKQVGQTIVQLPQVRQRSATSSQRGCSRLAVQQLAHIVGPHLPAHVAFGPRGRVGRERAVPRRRPARAAPGAAAPRRARCRPRPGIHARSPSSSVSARSKPASAFGPVFIDTQKHVPPACAAVHRDDERALAPRLVVRIDVRAMQEHPILNGDRVQLAGAHGEEGVALCAVPRSRSPSCRHSSAPPATAAATAGAGNASRHAGRHCSRTAQHPRAAAGGSGRPPARRSSRRADRRATRYRHRRSPGRAAVGRSHGTLRRAGRR